MNNPANAECREDVMTNLQEVIDRESPFAAAYKNMPEIERKENERSQQERRATSIVTIFIKAGPNRRRYNAPSHEEVAVVFISEDGAPPIQKDMVIYPRDRPLSAI